MARPRNNTSPTLFEISKAKTDVEKVLDMGFCKELGKTYYDLMFRLYCQHVFACRRQGMPDKEITSIDRFASEIVEAKTEAARVAILKPDAPSDPSRTPRGFQQYDVYISPVD